MTDVKLDANGQPLPVRKSTRNKDPKPQMDMWTRLKNPTGTIFLPEILKAVSKEKLEEDRVKMLVLWVQRGIVIQNTNYTKNYEVLYALMECLYSPKVIFDLPSGKPPYKENEALSYNDVSLTLYTGIRKIKQFAENPDKVANKVKRENIFIEMLEKLYKDEAELFLMMVNKKLDARVYPNINKELFKKCFPNINLWKIAQ